MGSHHDCRTHEKAGCFGQEGCSQLFLRDALVAPPWVTEAEDTTPREREAVVAWFPMGAAMSHPLWVTLPVMEEGTPL